MVGVQPAQLRWLCAAGLAGDLTSHAEVYIYVWSKNAAACSCISGNAAAWTVTLLAVSGWSNSVSPVRRQINLHTVTTLNQYLHNFSKVFLIVRTMPRPTSLGIRHEVFALACEGIKQGAIAARVGLTRATVNRILKRHAATVSLVKGKSSGAPRKTTPRQDRALLRMVRQDRFLSAPALTARMRNLYGMMAGRTTVNNRLLSRCYRAYRPTTKPLLIANHRRLRLEWAQRWRNLTVAHWQHVIFGDESRFQLYPVDGRLRVRRLPDERFRPGCQAHRVQAGGGSVHVWGAFHNSAKSPLVLPDGYLTGVLYGGILQNTLVPFARHYLGDNYRYQDDNATPHRARVVLDFPQQGNVTKMEQPPRSPNCNPIEHLWDE